MFRDLVLANRSYRRFAEDVPVGEETLRELVDLARCSPSSGNTQSLKFVLSWTKERNDAIFPTLAWAGYLRDWSGPEVGERPSGYITILGDTRIRPKVQCDQGIAAQTILLGAAEKGLGGCMIGSVNRDALRQILSIPSEYDIILVIAVGKPVERVVLEDLPESGSIEYYRDADGVHHVPKRPLSEIILDL